MKPLAPESTLQNRYQIVHIIGKGGMGEVYLATDTRLGNEVALKRTTVGEDQHLAAAFEREARTLAGLRHPVLPKVSDHFIENDEQFLVMDFIDGEDLSERLKKSGKPFPLNWVLFWADQLLEALSYLHTNVPPIIHRDIKPQNLKLTSDNQIVLLDFGLSKNALGSTRVTTSGSVVGYTPHYAPIEQIRGTGTNAKSDLYALSATLYQLLTNKVAPDALTRAESLLANSPDPLRPLTELNAEISDTLSAAIAKGMDVSQEKRFDDARQMQKALRRAYGSMQESMTAETVAFNLDDFDGHPAVSDSDASTEVGTETPMPTSAGEGVEIPTEVSDVKVSVPFEESQVEGNELLDVPVVEEVPAETGASDQVLDIPLETSDAGPGAINADDLTVDAFEPAGDVEREAAPVAFEVPIDSAVGDAAVSGSEEPEAAVPVDSADTSAAEDPISGEFDTLDAVREQGPETAAGAVAASPPPKKSGKSSAGKYIAIVLGLGAVLILVLGAVGAGFWYYTQRGAYTGNENTAEPTPTVESTVEVALPAETPPDNGNTENGTALDENVNTENAGLPSKQKTPAGSTPQTRPTVRRTPMKTPVKITPPPPPPPKPTPTKKKDPGVI